LLEVEQLRSRKHVVGMSLDSWVSDGLCQG
jgi:hypothetical protein